MARLLLALTVALVGCADQRYCASVEDGQTVACIGFTDIDRGPTGLGIGATLGLLCEVIDAEIADGTCPREGRIGGCASDAQGIYTQTDWYYEGGGTGEEDIECLSDETRLDGDGEVYVPLCSGDAGAAIVVTFANQTDEVVTVFWVDGDCSEQAYHFLAPGQSGGQSTYAGHVWRARRGNNDLRGEVVWEQRLSASDDGGTLPLR